VDTEEKKALSCKNCGKPLGHNASGITHEETNLRRCLPWDSGQAYGVEAELPDE
jgi:hypothetical protein